MLGTLGEAGFVAAAAVLASAAVLLRDVGISKVLGRTGEADALLAGLVVATTIAQLVPATFQTSVVPVAVEAKIRRGADVMQGLLGAISMRFALLAAGLASFLFVGRRPIADLIAPGSGGALATVLGTLSFFVVGVSLTELARSVLSLNRRYLSYALVGCIGNAILFVLITVRRPDNARHTAALASVAFLVAIPVAWTVCLKSGLVRFGSPLLLSDQHRIYRQAPPSLLAGILTIAMSIVDQIFTISLGSGSYATLAFAQRWPLFAAQLPAFAFGMVMLRTMSEDAVQLDSGALREKVRRSAIFAFGFGVLTTVGGFVVGPLLVRLTLRGGEFSGADAAAVVSVQQVLFLLAPFYMAGIVYLRLLNVLRKNGFVPVLGALSLALNVFLDWAFTRHWNLGVRGIALATVLVYVWSSVSLITIGEFLMDRRARQSREN